MGQIAFQIIASLFLIQSWIPNESFYFALNGVSWYLSTTVFLYAIFPFISKIIGKISEKINPIIQCAVVYFIMFFIGMTINACFDNEEKIKYFTYVFPIYRSFDFSMGCLCACIYKKYKIQKKAANFMDCLFLILSFLTLMAFNEYTSCVDAIWLLYNIIS